MCVNERNILSTIQGHMTVTIKDEIIIENAREELYKHLIDKLNTTEIKIMEAVPYTIKAKYFKISIQEGGRAKLKLVLEELAPNRTRIEIEITVIQDKKKTQIHNYCICLSELMKCLYMADQEGIQKTKQNKLTIDQEYDYFVNRFINRIYHKRKEIEWDRENSSDSSSEICNDTTSNDITDSVYECEAEMHRCCQDEHEQILKQRQTLKQVLKQEQIDNLVRTVIEQMEGSGQEQLSEPTMAFEDENNIETTSPVKVSNVRINELLKQMRDSKNRTDDRLRINERIKLLPDKQRIQANDKLPILNEEEEPLLLYNNCDWENIILTTQNLYVNLRDYENRLYVNVTMGISHIEKLEFETIAEGQCCVKINSKRMFAFSPFTEAKDIQLLEMCVCGK